jgi:hypothetical protein
MGKDVLHVGPVLMYAGMMPESLLMIQKDFS